MVLTCNDKYIFIIFLWFEFCILYTGNIITFRYFAEIPEHLGKPPQVKIFLIISLKKIYVDVENYSASCKKHCCV